MTDRLLDEIEAALAEKDARIAELEALLSQTNEGYAECIATREDYRARIAELTAALKPFADAAVDIDDDEYGHIWERAVAMNIDCDDLRAARAAYLGEKE